MVVLIFAVNDSSEFKLSPWKAAEMSLTYWWMSMKTTKEWQWMLLFITVTCESRHLKSPTDRRFVQQLRQGKNKNIEVRITGPLWGERTDDKWIPVTKGQWHGKRFHVMKTLSYDTLLESSACLTLELLTWYATSSTPLEHDDVIKWKHFPRYWSSVRGIHRSPVNSPHKGQWRGALMFSLICVWINGGVNNREAGDLRRYRTHYDVSVMEDKAVVVIIWVSWFAQVRLAISMD